MNKKIDLSELDVDSEYNVLLIDKNTPLVKVHYIFTHLDIVSLYVIDETGVIGFMTKEKFFAYSRTKVDFVHYPTMLEGSKNLLH